MDKVKVLFVCLGNICRSPTAHGVFQHLVSERGLSQQIDVDSAGTSDWHIGRSPDSRAQAAALQRGCDLSALSARQVSSADFYDFDYILAMDNQNLQDLEQVSPAGFSGYLELFLPYGNIGEPREVPDPYYGGEQGFDQVLDMVELASTGLLNHICKRQGWS